MGDFSHSEKMISRRLADYLYREVVEGGIFLATTDGNLTPKQRIRKWTMLKYHLMAKDQRKIDAYIKSMEQASVAGKVVVEIGPGALAPLTLEAARLGAKKIYAIEANPKAARACRKLIKREGFENIVEVVSGRGEEVSLPEKADILVHELIGQIASDEGVVSVMRDVIGCHATTDTILIPSACRSFFVPVQYPNSRKKSRKLKIQRKNVWNFPKEFFISTPAEFEHHDFRTKLILTDKRQVEFGVSDAGTFEGFLFWTEIEFSPELLLDTFKGTSWSTVFVSIPEFSFGVVRGDSIVLETSEDLSGHPLYGLKYKIVRKEEVVFSGALEFC